MWAIEDSGGLSAPGPELLRADAALVGSVRQESPDAGLRGHLGERGEGRADDGRQRDTVDIGQTPGRKSRDALPGEGRGGTAGDTGRGEHGAGHWVPFG